MTGFFYFSSMSKYLLAILVTCLFACQDTDVAEEVCQGLVYVAPYERTGNLAIVNFEENVEFWLELPLCNPDTIKTGIFEVRADMYKDCNGSYCLKITDLLPPYCVPEVPQKDETADFYGDWEIEKVKIEDELFYPDCGLATIRVSKDSLNYTALYSTSTDTDKWFDLTIGYSRCFNLGNVISDSQFVLEGGICQLAFYGHYFHYFESKMDEVIVGDTVNYIIENNKMLISNKTGDAEIHLFK